MTGSQMSKKATSAIDKEIGARVRLRRNQIGMSQEKLADALGITFQQVQKYEKGTNRISVSRLDQSATAVDVRIGFFLPSADAEEKSAGRAPNEKDSYELIDLFNQLESKPLRRAIVSLTRASLDQQRSTKNS